MLRLSLRDSSILTRVAQYEKIPVKERLHLLVSEASEDAQKVGRILLGLDKAADAEPDVRQVAESIEKWVAGNRRASHRPLPRRQAYLP